MWAKFPGRQRVAYNGHTAGPARTAEVVGTAGPAAASRAGILSVSARRFRVRSSSCRARMNLMRLVCHRSLLACVAAVLASVWVTESQPARAAAQPQAGQQV